MAHNLNFNEQTGNYSFFSVQQKAWHVDKLITLTPLYQF